MHSIEDRFRVCRCLEEQKEEFAAYQLQGPADIWWSHQRNAFLAGQPITWDQFKVAFRGHYIPPSLMKMKAGEFMRLTQGAKTLTEYLHTFNNLAWYAPTFVNTEEKKIDSFKRGLGTKHMKTMANSTRTVFSEFISDCITQENQNNLHTAAKGPKRVFESGTSQPRAPVAERSSFIHQCQDLSSMLVAKEVKGRRFLPTVTFVSIVESPNTFPRTAKNQGSRLDMEDVCTTLQ